MPDVGRTGLPPVATGDLSRACQQLGGGVYPLALGNNINNLPDDMYFEARVELPAGAQITDVTFFSCGPAGNGKFYFGAYSPGKGIVRPILPEA